MTMKTDSAPNTAPSGTNPEAGSSFGFAHMPSEVTSGWSFRWSVHRSVHPSINSEPTDFGQVDYFALQGRLAHLQKLEQQHRERLAAVALDTVAQRLLNSLDRETSIKWEDLPNRADGDWTEACRSAALLAGANLCEVGPTRFRLNEYGNKLLAESPQAGQTQPAIGS